MNQYIKVDITKSSNSSPTHTHHQHTDPYPCVAIQYAGIPLWIPLIETITEWPPSSQFHSASTGNQPRKTQQPEQF